MNKIRGLGPWVMAAAAVWPALASAQSGDDDDASLSIGSLAPIQVESLRLSEDVLSTPAAVDVVQGRDVTQGRRKTQLDSALNRTPGVYANNGSNFAQNLRVSIRGFGARSAFGVRGVRVLVDGIPETLVDGQAQTDSIDLGAIDHLEVLRGPFSALYGNATGGVIDIDTLSPDDGPLDQLEFSAGGDGYRRESYSSAHRENGWGYAATASRLEQDGFREHSHVLKNQFTGKLEHDIGDTGTLRIVTRLLDAPDTEDPGGITKAQARADRHSAYAPNRAFNARQTATQETIGAVYQDAFSDRQDIKANVFYTHRNFIQYLPFETNNGGGVVTYRRNFFGGGLQSTRYDTFAGHDNQLVFGVDAQTQQDNRQRYNNEFGAKGANRLDQDEDATTVGLFAQNVFSLTQRLDLTTGLRYDWLNFDIDDHYPVSADDPDDSGSRHYHRLSANAGLSYAWATHQRVYFNIANAFESPTFTEFGNPNGQGGFNPDLAPQKAVNYDIGAKGDIADRGRYQIDAFWVNVRDELVAYSNGGDRDFYRNAGRSRRKGIEAKLSYDLTSHLSATAAYTLANYTYREYTDDAGNDYAGNRLPGIPERTLFGELAWRKADFGYAVVDVNWVGDLYADDANTAHIGSHTVVNARLGKTIPAGDDRLTAYVGLDNVFDANYYDNIRINAFGGRYYEPAPDRTLYAGLQYRLK